MNVSPTAPAALLLAHQHYHTHAPPDPGGLNPDGIEFMAGEEPSGHLQTAATGSGGNNNSRSSTPPHLLFLEQENHELIEENGEDNDDDIPLVQPPTPARKNTGTSTSSTTPVMALLIASPPPPPKMSLRKSSRGSSSSSSPRKLSSSPRHSMNSSKAMLQPPSPENDRRSNSTPRSTTSTKSSSSSSGGGGGGGGESIVERRLRAARAIYSSESLALGVSQEPSPPTGDPPVGDYHGRPSLQGTPVSHSHDHPEDEQPESDSSPRSTKSGSSSSLLSRTPQRRNSQEQLQQASSTAVDLDDSIVLDDSMVSVSTPPRNGTMNAAAAMESSPMLSPMSQATEPHSNTYFHQLQHHHHHQRSYAGMAPQLTPVTAATTPSGRGNGGVGGPAGTTAIGRRLADNVRHTPERLRRVLTPERRRMPVAAAAAVPQQQQQQHPDDETDNNRTPERRHNSRAAAGGTGTEAQQQQQQGGGKKKGFFRKILRGLKKKSSSSVSESGGGSSTAVGETATNAPFDENSTIVSSLESPKRTTTAASKASSSSAPSSSTSMGAASKKRLPTVNDDERDDEIDESKARALKMKKQRQQKQHHHDTGAEPVGNDDRHNQQQRDVFFHDDVSTLTGPTVDDSENKTASSSRRRSREPVETASVRNSTSHTADPMGHYFHFQSATDGKSARQPTPRSSLEAAAEVDPFTEAFFDDLDKQEEDSEIENDSAPPSASTSIVRKADLRVEVAPHHDPVGESPLSSRVKESSKSAQVQQEGSGRKNLIQDPSPRGHLTPSLQKAELETSHAIQDPSPRGYKTPSFQESTALDPLGESPMHQHRRGPTALVNGQPIAPDPPFFVDVADENFDQEDGDQKYAENKNVDDDSGEEKKSDEPVLLSVIAVAPPPPPPPPPPPAAAISVPARNTSPTVAPFSPRAPVPPPPPPRQPSPGKRRLSPIKSQQSPRSRQAQRNLRRVHRSVSPKVVDTSEHKKAIHRRGDSLADDLSPEDAKPSPFSDSSSTGFSFFDSGTGKKLKSLPQTEITKTDAKPSPFSDSSSTGFSFFDSDTGEKLKSLPQTEITKTKRKPLDARKEKETTIQSGNSDKDSQATEEATQSSSGEEVEELNDDQSRADSTQPKKSFISSVARMNAKAVAYLHTLNGEASPRRSWQTTDMSEEDASPVGAVGVGRNISFSVKTGFSLNVVKNNKQHIHKKIHSNRNEGTKDAALIVDEQGDAVMQLFQAYSSRFKGRKLTSKPPSPCSSIEPNKQESLSPKVPAWKQTGPLDRNIKVTSQAVAVGISELRFKREVDIATGKKMRVIPTKKREVPAVKSFFEPRREAEPKDPIQRAGRRLLSKAAIPIQSAARRFLAQREAVDRMWALIEIQSYLRRWRAEANLLASSCLAVKIQKTLRGFSARKELHEVTNAAIQIQRMIRGYLAAAFAFDTVYSVILTQAQARGYLVRQQLAEEAALATCIQSRYRGYKARRLHERDVVAVGRIQTTWRRYCTRRRYQFALVDIIISQSIVRSWFARRELANRRHAFRNETITKLQAVWRGFQAYTDYIFCMVDIIVIQRTIRRYCAQKLVVKMRRDNAALRLQTQWRMLVKRNEYKRDRAAVCMQSSWRMKQAKKLLKRELAAVKIQAFARTKASESFRRRIQSAVVIQTSWRSKMERGRQQQERAAVKIQARVRAHRAQVSMLYDLVHIILAQSVVRRYMARFKVYEQQKKLGKVDAAIRMQSAWRGFWKYSHYVIMQFEAGIIQAMMRGALTRKRQTLRLGRSIMIQAAARRYIAKRQVRDLISANAVIATRAKAMREKCASRRIQFWWRVVMTCRKEKEAALVIERFFVMVKEEVEREIRRYEKKKQLDRRGRRRRHKKEADDSVLERVWLNTVDSSHVDVFALTNSPSCSSSVPSTQLTAPSSSFLSSSSKLNRKAGSDRSIRHRASSPTMNLVMRRGRDTDSLAFSASGDSNSMNSRNYTRRSRSSSSRRKQTRTELSEDLALEEAFLDAHLQQDKAKQKAAEKYLERYGIKTGRKSKSTTSTSTQFFSDEKSQRTAITQTSTFRSAAAATSSSSLGMDGADNNKSLHRKKGNGSGAPPKKHIRDSPRHGESPRHGKILVMNPYPADNYIIRKESRPSVEEEEVFYDGEEFGMI